MDELKQNIEKLNQRATRDAFKVYVYEKVKHIPSDVALLAWTRGKYQPSGLYQGLINDFFKNKTT